MCVKVDAPGKNSKNIVTERHILHFQILVSAEAVCEMVQNGSERCERTIKVVHGIHYLVRLVNRIKTIFEERKAKNYYCCKTGKTQ